VEHKTFIDCILKETTENLLQQRYHWVSSTLLTDGQIKEAAVENTADRKRRQELKDKKERMEKCLAELKSMSLQHGRN